MGEWVSTTYMTFTNDADAYHDNGDAKKLLPLEATPRIAAMSIIEDTPYKINNLPLSIDSVLMIPVDILILNSDTANNFVIESQEVSLTFGLEHMPDQVFLTLIDNINGTEYDPQISQDITIVTESKGRFSAVPDYAIGSYSVIGEPRITLVIHYTTMTHNTNFGIPKDFSLYPVYPNPFNPTTVIRYDIPKISDASLSVFDLRGRLIKRLMRKRFKPGRYHYRWVPDMVASGVYILRMQTEEKVFNQKITYIK